MAITKNERLLRLERRVAKTQTVLSDEQARRLERFSPETRERHIETRHTGDLVAVDTFFVGRLKGVGKVYLQSAIDCHARYAWGRLYKNKLPVTAVHLLKIDILPTFEQHGAQITTILLDIGRDFRGRRDRQPYELFLQLEDIDHRTTRVRRAPAPHAARRTRVMGRTKWYGSLEQTDLHAYLQQYNHKRPHQGREMNGQTPFKALVEGLPKPSKAVAKCQT